ncbi:TetR/AcrR family transcriptional regulator [Sporolactobacillus vineae]|uniref:TetR/AcrR family transcriptional regulator n=1 Tax=Sporolactobacillus vineae TaxID=444463 RepID=UPI00028943DF|nr:TetR/AcrR family transcriptional regulator [Sporolactobacillus vineae]
MEASKEETILTAAIHEFAEKGFEQASTNRIAKQAGVSKGLIFHYFESKEKLFEACVNDAIAFSMKKLDYEKWDLCTHLMEKLKQYSEQELLFYKDYPDVYQLIISAFASPPEKLSGKMSRLFTELSALAPQFLKKLIDGLDLKDDVDPVTLLAVLQSHCNYYSAQAMGYLKVHPGASIDALKPIINQFLDMMAMSLRGLLKNEREALK